MNHEKTTSWTNEPYESTIVFLSSAIRGIDVSMMQLLAAVLRDRTSDQTLPENQILENVRTSKSVTL